VLLQKAYDRFPQSPGVSFVRGWLAQALGECGDAVRHFDAVIERDRAHEYAWLERTKCLSRLHNDSAAIASATALLDLRTASAQEALYWRAVSLLRLRELPRARTDIDVAKALERDGSTLTLAGMIENEQNDLAVAEGDLRAARAVLHGEQNCTATWTLALVLGKGARPAESAQMFEAAMGCYDIKVADLRYRIAKRREKSQPNPDFVAKRIAAMEADSADQRTRYYASALHAAGHSANAGQVPRALELLGIAARDPKLVSHVEVLRAAIAKRR
jgi:tetratricopeptide (TPR) repeat protein